MPSFGAVHLGTVLIESKAAPRRLWAVSGDHEHVVHGLYGPEREPKLCNRTLAGGAMQKTKAKSLTCQLNLAVGPCGVQVCEREGATHHAHAGCEACEHPHHGKGS